MHSFKAQRGTSFWGWLVILAVAGITILVAVKIGPKYFEYYSVTTIVDDVARQEYSGKPRKREVWERIRKRLEVDYVSYINADHIQVKYQKDGDFVFLDYEVREHILGNVDAVLSFQHQSRIGKLGN